MLGLQEERNWIHCPDLKAREVHAGVFAESQLKKEQGRKAGVEIRQKHKVASRATW